MGLREPLTFIIGYFISVAIYVIAIEVGGLTATAILGLYSPIITGILAGLLIREVKTSSVIAVTASLTSVLTILAYYALNSPSEIQAAFKLLGLVFLAPIIYAAMVSFLSSLATSLFLKRGQTG